MLRCWTEPRGKSLFLFPIRFQIAGGDAFRSEKKRVILFGERVTRFSILLACDYLYGKDGMAMANGIVRPEPFDYAQDRPVEG